MNDADVRTTVLRALKRIAPEANLDALRGDEDLRDALDIDSMDFNSFVLALHGALGVDIAEADYPRLFTLNSCVSELVSRLRST
jgi:acyl carrier protein